MPQLIKVTDSIHSFPVPYKDIFVQIYILQTPAGTVLFDTAACPEDVDQFILPALEQLGITPTHIFISHDHGDHAGGLFRVQSLFPKATVLSRSNRLRDLCPDLQCPEDGEILLDVLRVVTVPGHSADSAALLDLRTGTLVTGDCLQSFGIYGSGAWYGAIRYPEAHLEAIQKLRQLPIENIATAHDYHPSGLVSFGRDQVHRRLDSCIDALRRLADAIRANPTLEDARITALCNDGTLPTVGTHIIAAVRKAAEKGLL